MWLLISSWTCRQTALEALGAWPGGLHMGGGVNTDNAKAYIEAGASHVIVTSFVFREGRLDEGRLRELVRPDLKGGVLMTPLHSRVWTALPHGSILSLASVCHSHLPCPTCNR